MDRRAFVGMLAGGLLTAPLAVEAQPAGKVWRIGSITPDVPALLNTTPPGQGLFWDRMRELGWVYGQNVILEPRVFGQESSAFPSWPKN